MWPMCLACCIYPSILDSIYVAPIVMVTHRYPSPTLLTLPLSHQVAYKAGNEQSIHQYSISKDEPFFLQARANAAQLSEVPQEEWADVDCAPQHFYSYLVIKPTSHIGSVWFN